MKKLFTLSSIILSLALASFALAQESPEAAVQDAQQAAEKQKQEE